MNVKKLIPIVGIIMAVIAVFLGGLFSHSYYSTQQANSAKTTASTFVQDLVTGKVETAYGLTSKSLQSKQNKDSFVKAIGDLKADKPYYEAAQYTTRDGNFYYSQRVLNLPKTSTGSTSGDFYLMLTKDGLSWKVATVKVQ
jgi:hypothetical protein